ncbi:MAG: aspartate--tRNA ligase [Rhodospirillales bacterium]|nr:aspartate--tRNA ligase [Rhodospirillales bacterium]USO07126.1 MAG: aspartate--tRNA ligase [Rhodospirillales bacterium]
MHAYRTHNCAALRPDHVGQTVRLSGWIHSVRDHGGLLFIDLRDTFGLTQVVLPGGHKQFDEISHWRVESVITVDGKVVARAAGTTNDRLPTGGIEVVIETATLQSAAKVLPLQVASDEDAGEDVRLKYRYLDLRREKMQKKIKLRSAVVSSIRKRMTDSGFNEFQTPILTASSPEGARDFLVPSRVHPGKFYALPQAPQQFKQLLMMSGFDRYFQIAPCFRDEDGRADRLAEFYQLDVEMSFVTQDDVFSTMEPVIGGLFQEFSNWQGTPHTVTQWPWQRIPYAQAMLKYGSDKPDLRNPLEICDVTDVFKRDDVEFKAFKGVIQAGGVVRAIRAPKVSGQPRSFFDKLNDWARGEGAPGLGYIVFDGAEGKGPIAKFVPQAAQEDLKKLAGLESGDAVFFVCDKENAAAKFAGKARDKICDDMGVREKGVYKFCWIVDFPMYEMDEKTGKLDFAHNPFSMPQGGLAALDAADPLAIKAHQYDCVCNGYELASGAIRNHKPEIMERVFALAGYGRDVLERKFGGMLNAMMFGAPPHGGCAYGIDRIVMIFANEPNLREVYPFVMNGAFEDLLMNAPSEVDAQQLKDLHIKLDLPKPKIKSDEAA